MPERMSGVSGWTILLLGGLNVGLFGLRDWDSGHRLYHAAAIVILLATLPLMRSPVTRTLQAMILGASLAEILLRNQIMGPAAHHPLTPAWIGVAGFYALGFLFLFGYELRTRRGRGASR